MNKVLYRLGMLIIALAITLALLMSYLAFKPVEVIRPNLQPYKVLTKGVKAGDTLIYEVDACKFKDLQSAVLRRFVDQDNLSYPLPSSQNNVPPGCKKTRVPVIVPAGLHPGIWYLSLDVSYQVNPLRSESYHLQTESFTITQ